MIVTLIFLSDEKQEKFFPMFNEPDHYEKRFEVIRCRTHDDVFDSLNKNRNISMIITSEKNDDVSYSKYSRLFNELPNYWKTRWINFENIHKNSPEVQAQKVMSFFISAAVVNPDYFSVVTAVYETRPDVFQRTYQSLKNQKLKDWEWILIDDSKDKRKTKYIKDLAKNDFRIKYYPFEHTGNIGSVKKKGFSLASGKWLVELDHDDFLLPTALERIRKVFNKNIEIGFVFSNCAEIEINKFNEIVGFRNYATNDDGTPTAGAWGFSNTGSAEDFLFEQVDVLSNVSPQINSQSIRHITSCPNHVRVWKRDVYLEIGGHSERIHVADDYELMVRTFLNTRMAHLNSTEYVQFYEVDKNINTQYNWNREIQRITEYASRHYDEAIHRRFLELGVDDYSWNEEAKVSLYWNDFGTIDEKNNANIKIDLDDL